MKIFKNNSFKIFFLCSIFSLFGEGMFAFFSSLFVIKSTGQGFNLAQMMIITMLPSIILSPFIGVIMDKANVFLLGHLSNFIRLTGLILLVLSPQILSNLNMFYLLIGVYYIGWYISIPLFDTLLERILTPEEYKEGASWTQMAWQIGLLGSTAITGFSMSRYGTIPTIYIAITLDIVSTLTFIYLSMRYKNLSITTGQSSNTPNFFTELHEGFSYVIRNKNLFILVLIQAMIWPIFQGMNVLFPKIGLDILNFNEAELGTIDAFCGMGALISVFWCIKAKKEKVKMLLNFSLFFVAFLFTFFLGELSFIKFLMLYFLIGTFMGNSKILSRTLLLDNIDRKFTGRIMNLINMMSLTLAISLTYLLGMISDISIKTSYSILISFILIAPLILLMAHKFNSSHKIKKQLLNY